MTKVTYRDFIALDKRVRELEGRVDRLLKEMDRQIADTSRPAFTNDDDYPKFDLTGRDERMAEEGSFPSDTEYHSPNTPACRFPKKE